MEFILRNLFSTKMVKKRDFSSLQMENNISKISSSCLKDYLLHPNCVEKLWNMMTEMQWLEVFFCRSWKSGHLLCFIFIKGTTYQNFNDFYWPNSNDRKFNFSFKDSLLIWDRFKPWRELRLAWAKTSLRSLTSKLFITNQQCDVFNMRSFLQYQFITW